MAELDFKRHVAATTGQEQQLPQPIERQVKADISRIPDYQTALTKYGEATSGWMSELGSHIATQSSNAIATKLGGELGKNPQGELPPPLTNFDETVRKSYEAQAQATLGIEAQKLITKSNLELAAQPRIDSGMIAKTQQSTMQGLQKIFSLAPQSARADMEYRYSSIMMNQNEQLIGRMTREQKEDRLDKFQLYANTNNENAYALAYGGNEKASLAEVNATISAAKSLSSRKDITESKAQEIEDTTMISHLSGKYARLADIAGKERKLPQFTKSLLENPPTDIPTKYHQAVYRNILSKINEDQNLRSLSENLAQQKMINLIAETNGNINDIQWSNFESNVSPLKAEQMRLKVIQAKKAAEKDTSDVTQLSLNWANSEAQALASPTTQKKTFYSIVQHAMQSDPNLTLDQAEVQTALGAGSPVKVFLDTLNNKATSGNPTQILSAANQIQTLHDLEGGHALIGLNKQAEVIATQFNRQRGSMPDSDLARKITDNILNIDSGLQSTLDNAWNRKLSTSGAGGLSSKKTLYNFALSEVEIDKNDLGGKYFEVIYGNDIYDQLRSNFDSARGDYDVALEMTKNYVKQNFGETRANGTKQITDRPLEKVLGYTDHDVVPFIHEDALSQFNTKFIENKDPNDYWTTKPVNMKDTISSAANPFDKMYPAAEIIRHVKTAKGEKVYTYPVNFIGRPGKEWDVVVQTPSGPRNLFLVAPHLGIITYKPNERDINTKFAAHKKNKGWF